MKLSDLKEIPNAAQPTAGQGLVLDHKGTLPPTVLAPTPADNQALTYDAATNANVWETIITTPTLAQIISAGGVTVYDRATTSVDVQTSAAEASLYTKSVTGGDMSTNRMLRLTMGGDYLHNNVGADTATWRVKFGGTTFWAKASNFGTATGASRHSWTWIVRVANCGATNSQEIFGELHTERADEAAPTTGIGDAGEQEAANHGILPSFGISTLGAIDTTTAQTLDVTVQWSASSANNSWRMRYAVLELV